MSEPVNCDICGKPKSDLAHRSEKWGEATHCFTVNTRNTEPPLGASSLAVKHLGEDRVDVTFAYVDPQDGRAYRVVATGRRQAFLQREGGDL